EFAADSISTPGRGKGTQFCGSASINSGAKDSSLAPKSGAHLPFAEATQLQNTRLFKQVCSRRALRDAVHVTPTSVGLSKSSPPKTSHHKLLRIRPRTANPRLSLLTERELDFHERNPTFAHNFRHFSKGDQRNRAARSDLATCP